MGLVADQPGVNLEAQRGDGEVLVGSLFIVGKHGWSCRGFMVNVHLLIDNYYLLADYQYSSRKKSMAKSNLWLCLSFFLEHDVTLIIVVADHHSKMSASYGSQLVLHRTQIVTYLPTCWNS